MKILLAIDNSAASRKAFDFLTTVAKPKDEILLLGVVPDYEDVVLGPLGSMHYSALSEIAEEDKKQFRVLLRSYCTELGEKKFENRTCLLGKGTVRDIICTEAAAHSVDLIVVGQRSHMSTLESALDSESTAVLHHAHCSVIIVKFHPEELSNHEKHETEVVSQK